MLQRYKVEDRVNSRRGPGRDAEREPKLARSAAEEEKRRFAVDKEGYLVFPATVRRVVDVRSIVVEYDAFPLEECVEAVENVTPRVQMPWHPKDMMGRLVVMLTRNVKYGEAIEGLEARWHYLWQLTSALVARPDLFEHMVLPDGGCLPWREQCGADEPMHRWYDPKYGMFDVPRGEEELRRRYAPKLWQGELVDAEAARAVALADAGSVLESCDVTTPAEMMAAGFDVRVVQGTAGEGPAAEHQDDVVDADVFRKWMELGNMTLGQELQGWWASLEVMLEGSMEGWKACDAETAMDLFRRVREDLRTREWLTDGAVSVLALVRWCREVVSPRFGGDELETLEELADFLRVELRVVQEHFFDGRSAAVMEEMPDGVDVDVAAVKAAEKVVFGFPGQDDAPTAFAAVGRLERAHALEFPMGIGGLFDDARPRGVSPRIWAQHLLRLWGGWCVHGVRGHRLVWAVVNTVLLQEARGKGYIVQKTALRRLGGRMGSEEPLTRESLKRILQSEETAGRLVHSLMTVGQNVRSTPMQWARESKRMDCMVKYISWAPPWVGVEGSGGPEDVVRHCYLGNSEVVKDRVGHGRIPGIWWTLNYRYNCDYEIHRLNVGDALAREAVCSNDAASRRVRYGFVRDAPDIVAYMHMLRGELIMKMVTPSILPHSELSPYLTMARMETGGGGAPHLHGVSYCAGNPTLDDCREALEGDAGSLRVLEGVGAEASSAAAALAEGGDDASSAVASGGDRSGDEAEAQVGALFEDPARPAAVMTGRGARGRGARVGGRAAKKRLAAKPEPELPVAPEPRRVTKEEKEAEFWEYFHDKASEWNPCFGEDGDVRFLWGEDVGAHDLEVDVGSRVRLQDFCPDVASTPHTVRLRSLLERVLQQADGTPAAEVDLSPVRQLVAALVNKGNRHDKGHAMERPVLGKDPCARGKPECPYCRYGFPHDLRPQLEMAGLIRGDREGQWHLRFPRNDQLVGSYEAHVLLANLGNIDWRPMMNIWAVVEYVTKYAMKAPGGSKPMREVLREAVDEVCKYSREGDPLDLMRQGLQKFYSKALGGRDYGIAEAVHLGLGLPLVLPMMNVDTLNTQGVRVFKTAEHLAKTGPGGSVVWESRIDKFDRRLELVRLSWVRRLADDCLELEAAIRDVSLYEFYDKYVFKGRRLVKRPGPVALQVTPGFSADCARVDHELHEAYARKCVLAFWRLMPTRERYEMCRVSGSAVDVRRFGGTLFEQLPVHAGGGPSLLDRFLGLQDLYEAFEGVRRRELQWVEASHGWRERCSKRPKN